MKKTTITIALTSLALLIGCAAHAGDDDVTSGEEAVVVAPNSIPGRAISSGPTLVYGAPLVEAKGRYTEWTKVYLIGTPGDEVEVATETPAETVIVALGAAPAEEEARCARLHEGSVRDYCHAKLTIPVVAASTSSERARLRYTLTERRTSFAIRSPRALVRVVNLKSALEDAQCEGDSRHIDATSQGSFEIVTLLDGRESGPRVQGANVRVDDVSGTKTLYLEDSGGPFRSVGAGRSNSGIATTTDCVAKTRCAIRGNAVTCEPFRDAQVLRRRATALDSDECLVSQASQPVFRGTIANDCLALRTDTVRVSTPDRVANMKKVIVKAW